ncbi:MAG: TolC family protein [Chitinophagaceae bacterium]|nr:TolC family protein [Chitinophagaceae bacterium]MCW5916647.1 TolC family protein [Ferruginibacter sp.]
MQKAWISILFALSSLSSFSQDILSLEDAISRMKKNNSQLTVQQLEIKLTGEEISGTKAGFLPRLQIGYNAYYTNDPLNSFGFKMQQQSINQSDFNPALLNNPKAISHFNTKASLQQPILNFEIEAARKAIQQKLAATKFQTAFIEKTLAFEIKRAYTNLQFLYEAQKAIQKGKDAYQEVLRNTLNFQVQGYAKPTDVLMVKTGLIEVQSREVEIMNSISNLSDYLSWLMGSNTGNIYKPETELALANNPAAYSSISENRGDILALKAGIDAQKNLLVMTKRGAYPRINAFGEYNLNDKHPLGFSANSFMVGISLTWTIFNGTETSSKIRQQKLGIEKAKSEMQVYIQKSNLELLKATREVRAGVAKIGLAESAKEQADESLRILTNRYAQGLEKTSDLLTAQAVKLEKEVKYLESVKDYNINILQIEFLTQ